MLTRDDEMSEAALARENERRVGRFRRAVEKRRAGEAALPLWREREFWNLTSDPFPGLVVDGVYGLSTNFCPMG